MLPGFKISTLLVLTQVILYFRFLQFLNVMIWFLQIELSSSKDVFCFRRLNVAPFSLEDLFTEGLADTRSKEIAMKQELNSSECKVKYGR